MFIFIIYYLFSPFISILLLIVSFFNKKIQIAIKTQPKTLYELKTGLNTHKEKIIIHAASAGEYEQIKPVLRTIDKKKYFVIVTCMSSTIYHDIQKEKLIDGYCYHPFDFPWSAKKFFKTIKPSVYMTTRHDIWPIHLYTAKKLNIKNIAINTNLYGDSNRLKWYSKTFTKYVFNLFNVIVVPTKRIQDLFNSKLKINTTHLINDTRFEQIAYRKKHSHQISKLESISNTNNMIFGSIAEPDLDTISTLIEKQKEMIKQINHIIIVPHEIDKVLINNIKAIVHRAKYSLIKLSDLKSNEIIKDKFILIDKVGILPELYKYTKCAYVGGGFGQGVHSTIEPLIYDNITLYGPNIDLLDEAKEMNEKKCGFVFYNSTEAHQIIEAAFNNNAFIMQTKKNIKKYIDKTEQSSLKICNLIDSYV